MISTRPDHLASGYLEDRWDVRRASVASIPTRPFGKVIEPRKERLFLKLGDRKSGGPASTVGGCLRSMGGPPSAGSYCCSAAGLGGGALSVVVVEVHDHVGNASSLGSNRWIRSPGTEKDAVVPSEG